MLIELGLKLRIRHNELLDNLRLFCGESLNLPVVNFPVQFHLKHLATALFKPVYKWLYLLALFGDLCLERLDFQRRQMEIVNELVGNVRRADHRRNSEGTPGNLG